MPALARPRLLILGTGGTIAARSLPGKSGAYQAGQIQANDLLAGLRSPPDVECECEQLFNIGSQDLTEPHWQKLHRAVQRGTARDDIDGIVITHGTDTMEETAFFLDLTCASAKPIVLVGAMKPADARDADGPTNLRDALVVAAAPNARDRGVLVVARSQIHAAARVMKIHTTNVDAFSSGGETPLGRIEGDRCLFWYPPKISAPPAFPYNPMQPLPKVDIAYLWAGADIHLIEAALLHHCEGLVIAGLGNGNLPQTWLNRLSELARQGIRIVRASRVPGPVDRNVEVDDDTLGFIASRGVAPANARLLLALCIARELSVLECQRSFDRIVE